MERVGVREAKEVEDMVEVGRAAREGEDTGQTYSNSSLFPFVFICKRARWHISDISGRGGNTAMGTARESIVTATIASASTDTA